MFRLAFHFSLFFLCVAPCFAEVTVTHSPNYRVDKIYESMRGPLEERTGYGLTSLPEPELLWITGFRASAVLPESETETSQEFVCHNTLSFNYPRRDTAITRGLIPKGHRASQRLFTISQGQQKVRFPDGFGIPVYSDEPLMLQSQLLNLNKQDKVFDVKHKSETFFTKDSERNQSFKPLFMIEVLGAVPLPSEQPHANTEHTSSGCLSANSATKSFNFTNNRGEQVTAHWEVPPGRHVYENYRGKLGITYDTSAHYFLVHLHPYAESLELFDVTKNELVFRSRAKNYENKRGLDLVEHVSSPAGIMLYRDHEYVLTSTYNNTSSETQDAMTMLFIYALDKEVNLATSGVPQQQS